MAKNSPAVEKPLKVFDMSRRNRIPKFVLWINCENRFGEADVISRYDSDADLLLIKLRDEPPIDSVVESGGVAISYDDKGLPVSVEFLNASELWPCPAPGSQGHIDWVKSAGVDSIRRHHAQSALPLRICSVSVSPGAARNIAEALLPSLKHRRCGYVNGWA